VWDLDTLTLSLELDKQPGSVVMARTWKGDRLFRLSSHRWVHADIFGGGGR
jgi:hypothetical protein